MAAHYFKRKNKRQHKFQRMQPSQAWSPSEQTSANKINNNKHRRTKKPCNK